MPINGAKRQLTPMKGGQLSPARLMHAIAVIALSNSKTSILDLTNVTHLESGALGALLRLRNRVLLTHGNADVRIAGANSRLARIFSLTGLDKIFRMYPTLEEAMAIPCL